MTKEYRDALETIEGQLRCGYIDLGFMDELELEIVEKAVELWKIRAGIYIDDALKDIEPFVLEE